MRESVIKWMAAIAVVSGALSTSWLMAFVGGGWKQGVFGYVAWALMPYAVVTAMLVCARIFQLARGVHLLCHWASIVVALGGPVLYIDAMFVHVDAQGALVVLMIPVMQAAAGIGAALVAGLWQWRIHRRNRRSTPKADGSTPTHVPAPSMGGMKRVFGTALVLAFAICVLLYALISMLQQADSATIKIAKDVDAFIIQYCEASDQLPTSTTLSNRFPALSRDSGWFFYTDDKTFLIVQYPMRWWNKDAIGRQKISEFTATVYAYTVGYHCKKSK
ncbi:MAG: hypothetical protein K9J42_13355 [Sulfuritalea sp.]|nr:hypothetical protein [Sulfuritalea sp.]